MKRTISFFGFLRHLGSMVFIGAFLALTLESFGQKTNPPVDPMGQSKRIDAELQKLDQTPIGQKITDMEKKFGDQRSQLTKAIDQIREEYIQLDRTEAYQDYEKKRQALEDQRENEWTIERKAMAAAAKKIYAARHEELKKLAVSDTPHARQLGLDVLTYPRLDGSTSTHPLSVILASRVLGAAYEWMYPEPTGSPYRARPSLPKDLFLFDEYEYYPPTEKMEFSLAASQVVALPAKAGQERLAIMINSLLAISTSTHDAYTNLIEGKCDLNLTARAPSEDELATAAKKGVKIELQPIARDALVFIVNYKNPVKSISRDQVVQIYQGKIQTWRSLGGATNAITALWRERNSGSRELFDLLVNNAHLIQEPQYSPKLFSNTMGGPFNGVTREVGALGYSVYYYEHYMALSPYTRTVAIDGVEPNADTIASGKYPFTADVYAAYRANESSNRPAMKLLDWLVSSEGQAVVRESGYVPAK